MIYKLCIQYTDNRDDVEENYCDVLTNFYKYIETYDPSCSIHTWLHIVTKRYVYDVNRKRRKHIDMRNRDNDIEYFQSADDMVDYGNSMEMNLENYRELYNDDILEALDELRPQYRRALLYQMMGYKLKEIAELEYQNGALESRNIETVKSRLFLARQHLKSRLTRDGKRRTTEETDQDGIY